MTTRALLVVLALALLSTPASAAQCGCPPTPEPPRIPQPLPPIQPGGAYVWIAWVGKGAE